MLARSSCYIRSSGWSGCLCPWSIGLIGRETLERQRTQICCSSASPPCCAPNTPSLRGQDRRAGGQSCAECAERSRDNHAGGRNEYVVWCIDGCDNQVSPASVEAASPRAMALENAPRPHPRHPRLGLWSHACLVMRPQPRPRTLAPDFASGSQTELARIQATRRC